MRRDVFSRKIAVMEAAQKPILITHIMNKAHMNYPMVKRELEELTTKNLVKTVLLPKESFHKYRKRIKNSTHLHYVITLEGIEILNSVLKARAILME